MNARYKTIVIVLLFLFVISVFYLIYTDSQNQDDWIEIKPIRYEDVNNYQVVETLSGTKIVNEFAGLSFQVPENWDIEIINDEDRQGIQLSSRDPNSCVFGMNIEHYTQEFPEQDRRPQLVQRQIQGEEDIIGEIQEIIPFGNKFALRSTRETGDGMMILVEHPKNNMIFSFGTLIREGRSECSHKFIDVIDSVLID